MTDTLDLSFDFSQMKATPPPRIDPLIPAYVDALMAQKERDREWDTVAQYMADAMQDGPGLPTMHRLWQLLQGLTWTVDRVPDLIAGNIEKLQEIHGIIIGVPASTPPVLTVIDGGMAVAD